MTIQGQLVETPRGVFHVRRSGAPDSPLVIGLHGFPDIAATFDGVAAALVAAGLQFAAPQMRGYAPSTLDVPRTRTLFDVVEGHAGGRRCARAGAGEVRR